MTEYTIKNLEKLRKRLLISQSFAKFFSILRKNRMFDSVPLLYLQSKTKRLNYRIQEIEFNLKNHPGGIENSELQRLEKKFIRLETLCDILFTMVFVLPFLFGFIVILENLTVTLYLVILLSALFLTGLLLFLTEKRIKKITTHIRQIEFKAMQKK